MLDGVSPNPDLDRVRSRRLAARAAGRHPAPVTEGRSRNMQAIRRTDTKPEVALRSALHRRGLRFRKDYQIKLSGLSVRPDLVFTRAKVAVFIDGCFWHLCPQHGRIPTSNTYYWKPKLEGNRKRDMLVSDTLEAAGWHVVRIWQHVSEPEGIALVVSALKSRSTTTVIRPTRSPFL